MFGARILVLAAVLGAVAAPAASPAAQTDPAPAAAATPVEDVAARRAAVADELAAARAKLETAPLDATDAAATSPRREVELLERIDLLLSRQATSLQQETELTQTRLELESRLETLRVSGPAEPVTPSYLALEELRDRLDAERQRGGRIDAGVQAARGALEQARRDLDERERARRLAQEAVAGNTDPAREVELAARQGIARLESRAADELVRLRQRELAVETLTRDVHRLRLDEAQVRIDWMQPRVTLQHDDLAAVALKLAAAERPLRDELERAERMVTFRESQLFEARRLLDGAAEGDAKTAEEYEARRLGHHLAREQVTSLGKRLEWLADAKTAWDRRYAVVNDQADAAELDDWEDDVEQRLGRFRIARELLTSDLAGVRNDLVALQARADAVADSDVKRLIREQQAHLTDLEDVYETEVADLEAARRAHARLLDDIRQRRSKVSLAERFGALWRSVVAVWSYEVASIDDRPITTGKIVIALFLLLLGFLASRLMSAVLGRRLLRRFGMPEGAAAAIQSLSFYVLLLLFALFALRVANVPLTVFTILGGALAIGAGFGSQTIIKNFLSGLVLLAERPIRVGDLIQVGELYGVVERVGARSTRVRTGDNVDIVVPNSSFLEQNVINWTLSEPKVRVSVSVGVVYGSPTREVARLLAKAVTEHGRVLKTPPPIVLFTDFGDNSLQFEIHFWIVMRNIMDRRTIQSDVRYRIDGLFREAGLVIAFPQRDVHLDAASPLPVQVVAPSAPPAARTTGDGQPGVSEAPKPKPAEA